MAALLAPIEETTFVRMLRYALATGGDRLHFKPGCRPLQQGLGPDRELRFRQLTGEDTEAIAGFLLAQALVPRRLADDPCDAARPLYLFYELPGRALVEAQLEPVRGGLALHLDLIRPLRRPVDLELLEG